MSAKVVALRKPAARRINRGRGHSYVLDGQPIMGVTTIIKGGLPMPALPQWAARTCAEYVAGRREILTELGDRELVDLVKGAPFRERDAAANRGTEVHKLAERLIRDEEVDVPVELDGHINSYVAFLDAFRMTGALVERPVFSRKYRYGGTLDLLADTSELGRVLIDIKTSGSGVYGEVALQLAAYGHAEFYVDAGLNEVALPEIDSYAVVWVRADGYDVYPIDVTDRDFQTFLYVQQVAWWAQHRAGQVIGDAIWRREEVRA